MAKRLLILFAVVLAMAVNANGSTWKLYPYYVTSKIQNVYDTGDKIYYLNCNFLYQFDKTTHTTELMSFQNKLSDNQISQMYYDWENKLLFLAYANSNIDVIDDRGNVTNICGIMDALVAVHDYTLSTSSDHMNELESYVGKEIRDITFADGKAYVAMGYGYVVIDEETRTISKSIKVRRPNCVYSVAKIGNRLVLLTKSYAYYGDPESNDPINTYSKSSGTFTNAKLYPINDHSAFLIANSKLYNYDFSSSTPSMTTLVSAAATSVQKSATGFIANFAGQSYYYTIDETGRTATKQGTTVGFATANPSGDGTVWINDANGLYTSGSTSYYKINAITTDMPYWLKYNASMNLLYAAVSGPIARINNNPMNIPNVINTFNGTTWANATAYTAAGAGYAFEFSPLNPTTYVRASWANGIHKVTNNVLKTTYTSSNAQIGTYKPTPAFDIYGNLWVVCSYGNSSAPVAVLPAAKFAKTTATKSDWFVPSGLQSLNTGDMQRSRFLVSKKNNVKIYVDGDYPNSDGSAKIFCWDNGQVDPTINSYHLAGLTYFFDQDDHQVEWTYINHMEQDNAKNVWVGHTSGVFLFDPDVVFDEHPKATRPFVTQPTDYKGYLCEGYSVYDIGVERNDCKWLATDDGVYHVSPDGSQVLHHFTSDNSNLPGNVVYSVECDTVNDRVYVYTENGFAEYIADGDAPAFDYADVYVAPNPVEPDFTGMIKIFNLMEDSYVTITSRDGQVVAQFGPVLGSALWDGCGADGERVPTGLYNIYAAQGGQPATTGSPIATIMIIK